MNPIDFQGLAALDQPLVDQLGRYLHEKESLVGSRILHAIHPLPRESLSPVLPYSTCRQVKLAEAVDAFEKNVHQVVTSKRQIVSSCDWVAITCLLDTGDGSKTTVTAPASSR